MKKKKTKKPPRSGRWKKHENRMFCLLKHPGTECEGVEKFRDASWVNRLAQRKEKTIYACELHWLLFEAIRILFTVHRIPLEELKTKTPDEIHMLLRYKTRGHL